MLRSGDQQLHGIAEPGQPAGIDLRQLLTRLWRHRYWGLAALGAALLVSVIYLQSVTYKYQALLVVVPADQSGSSVPGGLAGLGSLVGINLSGEQGSAFDRYADAVRSRAVADRLSRDHALMTAIFSDQWNAASGRWVENPSIARNLQNILKRLVGAPVARWAPPDGEDLRLYIEEHVSLVEDPEKRKITLRFRHPDRRFAGAFLARLNSGADEFLRRSSLQRTTAYANYLERRLGQVTVAEYRQSLAETLAEYEKIRMMASADVSFASEAFGGITISARPNYPSPFLVLIVNVALALVLWAVAVLVVKPLFTDERQDRLAE
jgi:Chain length determinant protein